MKVMLLLFGNEVSLRMIRRLSSESQGQMNTISKYRNLSQQVTSVSCFAIPERIDSDWKEHLDHCGERKTWWTSNKPPTPKMHIEQQS